MTLVRYIIGIFIIDREREGKIKKEKRLLLYKLSKRYLYINYLKSLSQSFNNLDAIVFVLIIESAYYIKRSVNVFINRNGILDRFALRY